MKLLFAEDERSLSRAITHILEKNCYSVDAVYDGQIHASQPRPGSLRITATLPRQQKSSSKRT